MEVLEPWMVGLIVLKTAALIIPAAIQLAWIEWKSARGSRPAKTAVGVPVGANLEPITEQPEQPAPKKAA